MKRSRKLPKYIVVNGKRHLRKSFFRAERYVWQRQPVPFWRCERTHWGIAPAGWRWGLLWDRIAHKFVLYSRTPVDSVDSPADLERAREWRKVRS